MAPTHITLSDDALLAEYVELDQFRRILEQRVGLLDVSAVVRVVVQLEGGGGDHRLERVVVVGQRG